MSKSMKLKKGIITSITNLANATPLNVKEMRLKPKYLI